MSYLGSPVPHYEVPWEGLEVDIKLGALPRAAAGAVAGRVLPLAVAGALGGPC
jgi:hypothetical protein